MDDFVEVTEQVTVVMCQECNSLLWWDGEFDEDDEARWENDINDKVVNVHAAHQVPSEQWEAEWHPDYYVVNCFCCDDDIHKNCESFFVVIDTYGVVEKYDDTFGGCVVQTKFECEGCEECGFDD